MTAGSMRHTHVSMKSVIALLLTLAASAEAMTPQDSPTGRQQSILDIDDYATALAAAGERGVMLLVSIEPTARRQDNDRVAERLVASSLRERFTAGGDGWVFCRLGMEEGGRELVQSPALSELRRGPGIFVIDQTPGRWRGRVVSVLPRTPGRYYQFAAADLELLPSLPHGSLTQRSLILAVRRHPARPLSTCGNSDESLAAAAAAHAAHQARLRRQGHHGWEARSQQFAGGRGGASEVCAESWPDQDLLDSCVDCVACWRQSAGHWQAVSSPQAAYGYDISRGANGIWYATGIFIR